MANKRNTKAAAFVNFMWISLSKDSLENRLNESLMPYLYHCILMRGRKFMGANPTNGQGIFGAHSA
jgi:hypothetical protein